MSDLEENKFDLQIRSMLEDAEEKVPDRVWEAISDRLDKADAAQRRRKVLPWLRYTGLVSAAAAIALGIFFSVNTADRATSPLQKSSQAVESAIADNITSPADEEITGQETLTTDIPQQESAPAQKPLSIADDIRVSSVAEVASDRDGRVSSAAEITPDKDGRVSSAAEITPDKDGDAAAEQPAAPEGEPAIPQDTQDENRAGSISRQIEEAAAKEALAQNEEPWDETDFMEEEQSPKKGIRTSLTISGNAAGNSASGNTRSGGRPIMSVMRPDRNSQNAIDEDKNSCTYGIPLSFGLGTKIIFTDRWSLGIGVNYSLLNRTFSGTYTKYNAKGDPEPVHYSKIRNSQSYIGIPVNVYFSIVRNRTVDFYAYAGGTAEKCVFNGYRMGNTEATYKEKVAGFQFSANAGIGVEFIIADMLGIYVDPSVRYYFPDSRQPKSIRTVQPLSLGFEVGFRVRL